MKILTKNGLFQFGGKGQFDQSTLRILYYQYKEYIVPVVVIITSIVLFVGFCIPMIKAILLMPAEEKALTDKISVLEQNARFLSSLNEGDLDTKLQLISKALPPEKDYAGIIRALSDAAASAGVSLGDFSLSIGDLSKSKDEGGARLGMEMTLNVGGSMIATKKFIDELSSRLPLSQVHSVQVSQASATVNMVFYYRPFQELQLDENKVLQPMSPKDAKLIEELSVFQ